MDAATLLEQVMYGKSPNARVASLLSLQYFNPRQHVWESFEDIPDQDLVEFAAWDARMGDNAMTPYETRYGGRAPDPYQGFKPSVWKRAKNWMRKNGWVIPVIAAAVGTGALAHRAYIDKIIKDPKWERMKDPAVEAFLDIIQSEVGINKQKEAIKQHLEGNTSMKAAFARMLGDITNIDIAKALAAQKKIKKED